MEPPTLGAATTTVRSRREFFVRLSVLLLVVGGALVYATLFRRWAYHVIAPQDLPNLIPEDIAAATVYWRDTTNDLCGPFPAIWPGLALLSALPLCVAAIQRRVTTRFWVGATLLCVLFGAATMFLKVFVTMLRGAMSDSGWTYQMDSVTMILGFGGYGLMFLSALALWRLTATPRRSRRVAVSAESA